MRRGPESIFYKKEDSESRMEFAEKIRSEESGMIGGVLSRIEHVPNSLKRGIMMLAAAGALFSAQDAGAQEAWKKHFGYEGWQEHYGYGEKKVPEQSATLEGQKKAAERGEILRIQEVKKWYAEELHRIRLTIIDPVARDAASRRLEQRLTNEYLKAWLGKEAKIHAAEVISGQYRK